MASTSETGHLKNVTRFDSLIAFVTGYGPTYAPTNAGILLTALNSKKTAAEVSLEKVKNAEAPLNAARGKRKTIFTPLKPLATRIVGALEAAGAPDTTVKNAESINFKIQGRRANATPALVEGKAADTISVSQQSYDRLADYFQELIKLLETVPAYNPNEPELKIAALKTYQQSLITANKSVTAALPSFSNAITTRDDLLYNPSTGILETAKGVKLYVKSVFGAGSAQYAQIRGISFTQPHK
jgi:hypothetical protein